MGFEYTRKAVSGTSTPESIVNVAAGLADAINQSGGRFATMYTSATVKLSGTPHAGDVWTLTLKTGASSTPLTASHTVLAIDTLASIANALAAAVDGLGDFAVPGTDDLTDAQFTFGRDLSAAFAARVSVNGVNLQSDGKVSGVTGGSRVIVFSEDGTPFTVSVRLADSASQSTGFRVGGLALAPAAGSASVLSTTHWSNLVVTLTDVTSPDRIVGGAAWSLMVGTERDSGTIGVAGTPTVGETWTVTLVERGWTTVHTHVVATGETLEAVLAALDTSIDAVTGFSASHSTTSDPDTGTLLSGSLSIQHLGSFSLSFNITPASGEDSDIDVTIGQYAATARYNYVAGANRDITVPDSFDVTVVDNDAPSVLILQSGDSTNVVEPTEVVVLGDGYLSQKTSVRFKLEGTVAAGQVWTVFLTEANTTAGPPPSFSFTVPSTG